MADRLLKKQQLPSESTDALFKRYLRERRRLIEELERAHPRNKIAVNQAYSVAYFIQLEERVRAAAEREGINVEDLLEEGEEP